MVVRQELVPPRVAVLGADLDALELVDDAQTPVSIGDGVRNSRPMPVRVPLRGLSTYVLDATNWSPYYGNCLVATCGRLAQMNTKEEMTATTVRALNDAVNARDREAAVALFATDGVFRPGAAGASFEGREAIAGALFGFLGAHKSGQFETVHELFAGDEAYHEWKWAGVTNDGEPAESHGCDYYLIRDGKVAIRSTFRKV